MMFFFFWGCSVHYRLIFLLFLAWCPSFTSWAAPAQQAFGDWLVTCNNQNFCLARNVGNHRGLVMTLGRSAGAHTDAGLRIELGGPENLLPKTPAIAPRLLFDGRPLTLAGERWQVAPWLLSTSDSATINRFLQHIQDGQAISLKQGNQSISLAGLKAALLFIDDRQKRVGSETAWIGKGDEPPLSVPPAPALKSVARVNPTAAPFSREELNDLLDYGNVRMNNSACSLDPQRREIWVTPLTDEKALLIQSCESGAYNTIYLAWLVSREKPFTARQINLRLPFLPPDSDSRDIELVNATFDGKTQELTTLEKLRGAGDCGVQTRWRYDGQRFRLVRYAGMPVCDNWQGPDAWPTLWITR
ncbi:protein of unknown function DUF1176 [[Enterobacter] lignolyticus SCF1]|uniref:DUF1176 domain-containing protein n=1 Tax=Enterobacter lignolyticus (strain SCF1) TaxID=701347 RepID=E3G9F9_ENTLS|nr:protein of unknown function DUF1176 [[Enterobacter] lignolyticus SCF1]